MGTTANQPAGRRLVRKASKRKKDYHLRLFLWTDKQKKN